MNILIVTAHPSSQGFTHAIAKHYEKGAIQQNHTVEILDLYTTEIQQDFLRFEDVRETSEPEQTRTKMQKKILWADEIVIIHPLWWFDAPAILKNWFDQNFTSGFAYKYTPKTKLAPLKLLRGKTARIFITADGPWWLYLFLAPFRTSWKIGRLGFCGIKVKTFRIFASKRNKTSQQLQQWLDQVYQISQQ